MFEVFGVRGLSELVLLDTSDIEPVLLHDMPSDTSPRRKHCLDKRVYAEVLVVRNKLENGRFQDINTGEDLDAKIRLFFNCQNIRFVRRDFAEIERCHQ